MGHVSQDSCTSASELRSPQGVRLLTPAEQHEVDVLMEDETEEYDREVALANDILKEIRSEKKMMNGVQPHDSATSVGSRVDTQKSARSRSRLLHVVQRLPEGTEIHGAHMWGQRILRVAGVGTLAKYYLEQDGDIQDNMGWRIHLHFILQFEGHKSVLAQRIVSLNITLPCMTQVYCHDSLPRLTKYLSGYKEECKQGKVAICQIAKEMMVQVTFRLNARMHT